MVFRPLAGCGLFRMSVRVFPPSGKFPSPCGVWVVLQNLENSLRQMRFPSPCGVWAVSNILQSRRPRGRFPSPCGVWVVSPSSRTVCTTRCFRPLAGCGLFRGYGDDRRSQSCFRPLAGCGLFRICARGARVMTAFPSPCGVWVVSCLRHPPGRYTGCFRPLAGCGLFPE